MNTSSQHDAFKMLRTCIAVPKNSSVPRIAFNTTVTQRACHDSTDEYYRTTIVSGQPITIDNYHIIPAYGEDLLD